MQSTITVFPSNTSIHDPTASDLVVSSSYINDGTNTLGITIGNFGPTYPEYYDESGYLLTSNYYRTHELTDGTGIKVSLSITNPYANEAGNYQVVVDTTRTFSDTALVIYCNVEKQELPIIPPVLPMIYNRKESDVQKVKNLRQKWFDYTITESERLEWSYDLKGALNYSDLARIEANIYYLSEKYHLGLVTRYDDEYQVVRLPDILTVEYFTSLRNNVQAIYNTGKHYATTPIVPNAPLNTYQKWNDIEKILYDTYYYSTTEDEAISFTNELYAINNNDSTQPDYVEDGDALPVIIE